MNINSQLIIINLKHSAISGHSGNGNRDKGAKEILIVNLEETLLCI